MALYAMGDLHLSLSGNKSMEVFGPAWENYVARIGDALSRLTGSDLLVLAGDTSWGMSLPEAAGEGKPRLLVDHRVQDERFFSGEGLWDLRIPSQ